MDEKQYGLTEKELILGRNEVPAFGLDGKVVNLEELKKADPDNGLSLFQTAQVNFLMGTGQYERVQIMLEPAIKTTIQDPENYVLYVVKKPGTASKPTTRITTTTGKIKSTP